MAACLSGISPHSLAPLTCSANRNTALSPSFPLFPPSAATHVARGGPPIVVVIQGVRAPSYSQVVLLLYRNRVSYDQYLPHSSIPCNRPINPRWLRLSRIKRDSHGPPEHPVEPHHGEYVGSQRLTTGERWFVGLVVGLTVGADGGADCRRDRRADGGAHRR